MLFYLKNSTRLNSGVFNLEESMEKVKCPFCGYEMPIRYDKEKSKAKGIFIKCKGRKCKKEFEIKINVK